MVQWLVLCMVAMWGDIRFGMTGATLLATRSVRGAINFFQQMFGFCLNNPNFCVRSAKTKFALGLSIRQRRFGPSLTPRLLGVGFEFSKQF